MKGIDIKIKIGLVYALIILASSLGVFVFQRYENKVQFWYEYVGNNREEMMQSGMSENYINRTIHPETIAEKLMLFPERETKFIYLPGILILFTLSLPLILIKLYRSRAEPPIAAALALLLGIWVIWTNESLNWYYASSEWSDIAFFFESLFIFGLLIVEVIILTIYLQFKNKNITH